MKIGTNKKWLLLGTLVASLGIGALESSPFTNENEINRKGSTSEQLFPFANCDSDYELKKSRKELHEKHAPIGIQGIVPWPDITGRFSIDGIWVNTIRGTYAVLRQIEHSASKKYGALQIEFYSVCSHRLLAQGTRVLQNRDWETPSVSIPLRNQGLNGSNLRVYLKVLSDSRNKEYEYLEILVREARTGTRDHFFMDRFE